MKGKHALYGPVVNILLILGVIVAVYLIIVGSLSRLAPILGKLGLIDASGASETEEQEQLATERGIPQEDKEQLERVITRIQDSIEMCKNYPSTQKCTCNLDVPLFPKEYIIRIVDTQEGNFIAGYKADWYNDADIPRSEQVMPTRLLVQPCFSSTLSRLADDTERVQANPQEAAATLQAVYEPFFNLARQESPENPQLYAVVPERFADKTGAGSSCFWFDGGSPFSSRGYNGADDMEYRIIGERVENQESFKLLRVDSGHICFITDRERDVDDCHADSTFDEDYFHVAASLPACEPAQQQINCEAFDCGALDYNQDVCENNVCCRWIPGGQRQCFSKGPLDCGTIDCAQISAQYCEENECCRMTTTEERAQWTAGVAPECIARQ